MKIITPILRSFFLIIILLFSYQTAALSQETDSAPTRPSHLSVGISVGPAQSQITNNGTSSVSNLLSSKKNIISGALELRYTFSRLIGITTGVGYGSYRSELSLDSYKDSINLTDSDHDVYRHIVSGSGIKEAQKISCLNVPVCINFQVPVNLRLGFFLQTGVNLSIPLGKTYSSSGTFTYTEYYPAYNLRLKDIPTYGLVSNTKVSSDGSLELKTVNIYATACAGVQYFVSSKIQIGLGVSYDRSLSNISNYGSPGSFEISPSPTQINSMMGGSNKTTVQSIGLQITLRYFLK